MQLTTQIKSFDVHVEEDACRRGALDKTLPDPQDRVFQGGNRLHPAFCLSPQALCKAA